MLGNTPCFAEPLLKPVLSDHRFFFFFFKFSCGQVLSPRLSELSRKVCKAQTKALRRRHPTASDRRLRRKRYLRWWGREPPAGPSPPPWGNPARSGRGRSSAAWGRPARGSAPSRWWGRCSTPGWRCRRRPAGPSSARAAGAAGRRSRRSGAGEPTASSSSTPGEPTAVTGCLRRFSRSLAAAPSPTRPGVFYPIWQPRSGERPKAGGGGGRRRARAHAMGGASGVMAGPGRVRSVEGGPPGWRWGEAARGDPLSAGPSGRRAHAARPPARRRGGAPAAHLPLPVPGEGRGGGGGGAAAPSPHKPRDGPEEAAGRSRRRRLSRAHTRPRGSPQAGLGSARRTASLRLGARRRLSAAGSASRCPGRQPQRVAAAPG